MDVKNGTSDVQTAAAIATCVAAVGSIATAIIALFTARTSRTTARAAQRAAESSETTARDARQALGLATRPNLGTRYQADGRTLVASVQNHNQYAAADVSIRVHLRDGRVLSDKTELLAEAPGPMSKSGPYWIARFDGVLTGEPEEMIGKTIDYATVHWWDSQRIVQWEERTTFSPEHGWQQQEDRRVP